MVEARAHLTGFSLGFEVSVISLVGFITAGSDI